jgi:hypothetical protein
LDKFVMDWPTPVETPNRQDYSRANVKNAPDSPGNVKAGVNFGIAQCQTGYFRGVVWLSKRNRAALPNPFQREVLRMLPYLGPEIVEYLITRGRCAHDKPKTSKEQKPSDCGREMAEIAKPVAITGTDASSWRNESSVAPRSGEEGKSMGRLKMSWRNEGGQLTCRWVDSEEPEKGNVVSMRLGGADPTKEDGGLGVEVAPAIWLVSEGTE